MPRTVITATNVVYQESTTLTLEAADSANGMMFVNDGSSVLIVKNDDGALTPTVTIVAVPDDAGRAVNYTQVMAITSTQVFGPFRNAWWNQTIGNAGFVYVNFTDDTNVSVGIINY